MAVLLLAATSYFFELGRAGLDDAEAFSAYIASRKTLHEVFDASLRLDPGKSGGLYVFALHWYCGLLGTGEAPLRGFSAAFALASAMLVYALAADLFDAETALIATLLWAFNPLALIVARWARMYSMFIALTLGSLLAMRKVQQRPNALRVATYGLLCAAMLYTHLGAALMLAAEVALLLRDRWRRRAIAPQCIGIAIALLLFMPIAPIALRQVDSSALGHRFDWMGSVSETPLALKAGLALLATLAGVLMVFSPPLPFDKSRDDTEPMRWCAMWSTLPVLALMAASLILHPMFQIRYIAPVVAGFAIALAAMLGLAGTHVRNLFAVATASAFLIVAILFNAYHPPYDLWRRIGATVEAARSPSQEVFFEAGYVMGIRQAAGLDPDSLIKVLPDGYLRIPFDYYCHGANPRGALNAFRTADARATIAEAARHDGGAWLVSHMDDADLAAELPSREAFDRSRVVYDPSVAVSLFHIVPRASASK
jgi:hypothetical protein